MELKFDDRGRVDISEKDVKKLQKHFILFARNYTENVMNRNKTYYDSKRVSQDECTHHPAISKRSEEITKELHEKLQENKIPHHDFLLFKGWEYDKKREFEKEVKEKQEIEACTFQPNSDFKLTPYLSYESQASIKVTPTKFVTDLSPYKEKDEIIQSDIMGSFLNYEISDKKNVK